MTKEDICELYGIEEPILALEPWDVFSKGIVGVTEDKKHFVYGYYALVSALAEDYERQWKEEGEEGEKPDFELAAAENIDYNTIGSLPYEDPEIRPIIIYELYEDLK